MNCASVDRIVNALLYEGYILYPYRASSVKNHLRFNFGVVYPRSYSESQSGHDAWSMQTQCLASGSASASVEICVRFLRVVERAVGEWDGSRSEPFLGLPSIQVDGQIHESWQEAVEQRVSLPACSLGRLSAMPLRHEFSLPREREQEILRNSQGRPAGAIVRTREAIQGVVEAHAEAIPGDAGSKDAWRVTVRIVNTTELPAGSESRRDLALSYSLISAHTVLEIENGEFVSLLEPPAEFCEAASACRNEGTWPVLAGNTGEKRTVLSSPIILYDYPAVAPESPGDLFDSTEIDEILTLRVRTMSDQEKQEARRIDERARRILERADALDSEEFAKLHGTFRSAGGSS
jgi:hypothetical protein